MSAPKSASKPASKTGSKPTSHTDNTERFVAGTFAPDVRRANSASILRAQSKMESLLFLRHGEQQLLSLIIPMVMLIGLSLLPGLMEEKNVQQIYPMTLAIALMGAAFTGQAIAVAFDRRYGALKRIGASGVPTWALIGGKVCAVAVVVAVQVVILTITAAVLGWSPQLSGIGYAIVVGLFGVAAFTSCGLLLGGTLSSEMVLALSNTVWFIFVGAAVFSTMASGLSEGTAQALKFIPSVALTDGFSAAMNHGQFDWLAVLILLGWAIIGTALTFKFFSFTMDTD